MADNYTPPEASLEMVSENNSGQGKVDNLPEGIKGFSWGAFLLTWIWAIGNSTWIGLLALVPYVGFIVSIYLGFKGREMAWQNKRWDSVEHFQRVQKQWSFWGVLIIGGIFLLGILSAILIPAIQANA
ncbi:hypothetical protein [Pseudoalteromonas sp. MEBiC 03485]|uniref:hypothetical protein n=1 Tax=Pseudoalteromonas sp. MEBiC 03485 TaxID=2571103 RepID=UPI0010228D29|nr:hypothetical protein [Pseudoalteromonas sp. MEBiC 03485]RZD22137.1 hypothetical protein EVU92_08750 [Pseudoalteromonas sp. MEBiC 03485]